MPISKNKETLLISSFKKEFPDLTLTVSFFPSVTSLNVSSDLWYFHIVHLISLLTNIMSILVLRPQSPHRVDKFDIMNQIFFSFFIHVLCCFASSIDLVGVNCPLLPFVLWSSLLFAHRIFDKMLECDLVSYKSKIDAYMEFGDALLFGYTFVVI
jgi:hypothetical protein